MERGISTMEKERIETEKGSVDIKSDSAEMKKAAEKAEKYIKKAMERGADHAVFFRIEDIEFDPRALLKCMFGCNAWGKGHTCPSRPGSLKPWEYEQILRRYSWGIIIHSHSKKTSQDVSFSIESEAFTDGYYMAFSLSDCAICPECGGERGTPCANPRKARPAFHSVGIDVFKTVRKFGLPLETLKTPSDEQNWYSAVFIE
jgi:predicted metal-binding protein